MKKRYDVVIVGGGISGLSCARKLSENKADFLVVTSEVGGRILTSEDGKVNYGAYYVTVDYKNVLPFVKIGRRIKLSKIIFHHYATSYSFANWRLLRHPIQLIRLVFLLFEFRHHYEFFKRKCEHLSQKKAIEEDGYLMELYSKPAIDYIKEKRIFNISEDYVSEILHATAFSKLSELSAAALLMYGLLIIIPIYEFIFDKQKMIAPLKRRILLDTVYKISRKEKVYHLKTQKGRVFLANKVVFATPIQVSKKLLNLTKIKKSISAYMFHIKGVLHENLAYGDEELFGIRSSTLAIAHQEDGTYLFYSKKRNPNLLNYFKRCEVIAKKHWNPAFNTNGNVLIEADRGNGLYLIGDYNVCGLEDSFITGVYAANQIIKG